MLDSAPAKFSQLLWPNEVNGESTLIEYHSWHNATRSMKDKSGFQPTKTLKHSSVFLTSVLFSLRSHLLTFNVPCSSSAIISSWNPWKKKTRSWKTWNITMSFKVWTKELEAKKPYPQSSHVRRNYRQISTPTIHSHPTYYTSPLAHLEYSSQQPPPLKKIHNT